MDHDPPEPPARQAFADYGVRATAEYRANFLYVDPIALAPDFERRAHYLEHRLRLDGQVDYEEVVAIRVGVDALDGVLFGNNDGPAARALTNAPSDAWPELGYRGGDPFAPESYGYVFSRGAPVYFRRAYGELTTKFGRLRIGRQAADEGASILNVSGDGRVNRFGFARRGDARDRVLYTLKPLELVRGRDFRDESPDRGLFTSIFYDRLAERTLRGFGSSTHGAGIFVALAEPLPERRQHVELEASYTVRWARADSTTLHLLGASTFARADALSASLEGAAIVGGTRELSRGVGSLFDGDAPRQNVRQYGARAVLRWDEPSFTLYTEFDYASGDSSPSPASALRGFAWARDNNVGLLLFDQVLAYASAESAAAASAMLESMGRSGTPGHALATRGAFTNAFAIFPQLDLKPVDALLVRSGILMAWTASDLVDPVRSLRAGTPTNYQGGRPGHYYGTELDFRVQYRYLEHFLVDLEAALLFPGDALQSRDGRAARSALLSARTTFVF